MTDESIHSVKRVKEIRGSVVSYIGGKEMDVNQFLAEGWMLLHVYSDSIDSDHGPAQTPVYILGWTYDHEAPSEVQARVDFAESKESWEEMVRALRPEGESEQ